MSSSKDKSKGGNSSKADGSTAASAAAEKAEEEEKKKGIANFARKTWDEKEYATKALAREERYSRQTLPLPGSERSFAQARASSLGLEAKIGRSFVNADGSNQNEPGFYCKACDRVEKDHMAFLDHLNSTRHLLQVGSSTRVARSSVDSVKQRLRDKLKNKMQSAASAPPKFDYEARIQARKDAIEQGKKAKQQRKNDKKRPAGNGEREFNDQHGEIREESKKQKKKEEDDNDDGGDPALKAMQAMMGFGSFGTSKK